MCKPLIILTGPTAVGKTALSIALAELCGGEIISADSMQVYLGMDIGTDKIKKEKMGGIPHHLIDIISPKEAWSVSDFKERATKAMEGIYERGHIPIIVGGTGFYIQSVLYDIEFNQDENTNGEIRRALEEEAKRDGIHGIYERLKAVDPESCLITHENNEKRVIRAYEYYLLSGEKMSEHNKKQRERTSPYNFAYFVLNDDRKKLYERIEKRIDEMLKEGLVDEVKALYEKGYDSSMTAMQGLGYKEIFACLEGRCDLKQAVCDLKQGTRHFAKRQITWFKREENAIWLDRTVYKEDKLILKEMERILKEKGIIC